MNIIISKITVRIIIKAAAEIRVMMSFNSVTDFDSAADFDSVTSFDLAMNFDLAADFKIMSEIKIVKITVFYFWMNISMS